MENNYASKAATQSSAAAGTDNNSQGKVLPLKKFKAGPVSATIWENQGQAKDGSAVSFKTVKLERSYKDRDGEWQNTASMRINDLPRAALVANKAYEYLSINTGMEDLAA